LADIQEGWFYEGFQDENIVLDILWKFFVQVKFKAK
jgi:hypothetical protein